MGRVLIVGIVLLIAIAGCSWLGASADFAPGVKDARVVNVSVLANRSYTFTRNATQRIEADGYTYSAEHDTRVQVGPDVDYLYRHRVVIDTVGGSSHRLQTLWRNATIAQLRTVDVDNGTVTYTGIAHWSRLRRRRSPEAGYRLRFGRRQSPRPETKREPGSPDSRRTSPRRTESRAGFERSSTRRHERRRRPSARTASSPPRGDHRRPTTAPPPRSTRTPQSAVSPARPGFGTPTSGRPTWCVPAGWTRRSTQLKAWRQGNTRGRRPGRPARHNGIAAVSRDRLGRHD